MSAGLPAHATSVTSSGRIPITTRAPASPSTGRRSQTEASSLTGLPLRPSYVATAIAPGAVGDRLPRLGEHEGLVGQTDDDGLQLALAGPVDGEGE